MTLTGSRINSRIGSFIRNLRSFGKDERGDSHIIAVILVMIVVIALAAVFRNQITDIVNNLLSKAAGGGAAF